MLKSPLLLLCLVILVMSCKPEPTEEQIVDNVDRKVILTHWADQIIIPAYTSFSNHVSSLSESTLAFQASPSLATLSAIRQSWHETYRSWQSVSLFEIGKADEIRFRNNLNIYPTNVDEINENIVQGGYNLDLPFQIDRQGFPALDYLLYGLGNTEEEILTYYTTEENAAARLQYLVALVSRIESLSASVLEDWTNGYRDEYIFRDGSDANASFDQTVNAILFYYEKFLRAGKVGIPAGVFSGTALPNLVEARYAGDISKDLLLASLDAFQDFFNGTAFGTASSGPGLAAYLDELDSRKGGELLSSSINQQFDQARAAILELDGSLFSTLTSDLSEVLTVYDALQKNVVLMKVDMMQALSVNVSYVDADGD